jgi:rubrerythrin
MSPRSFSELSPEEILMVAIDIETVNGDRLRNFAEMFADYAPDASELFRGMATEEDQHRQQLEEVYKKRHGDLPKTVGQDDIVEVIEAHDLDDAEHMVFDSMTLKTALESVLQAEFQARDFYLQASREADQSDLAATYKELGEFEQNHVTWIETRLDELENATA